MEGNVLRVKQGKQKRLGIEDVGRLLEHVEDNENFTAIELSQHGLGDDAVGLLSAVALRCRRLRRLTLSGNAIGDDGVRCIADTLRALTSSLVYLDLSNNKFESTNCKEIAEAFFERGAIAANGEETTLTLDLSDNPLTDNGVIAIGQVIDGLRLSHSCLKVSLMLRNVGCSNRGFMKVVHIASSLVSLRVANNPITPTSVAALCPEVAKIRELDLSYLQPIEYDGDQVIGQRTHIIKTMLRDASALREFKFSGNSLGDDGVKELAEGLKENKQHPIEHLALSNNDIGSGGVAALVDAFRSATEAGRGLRILELDSNRLDDTCAHLFADMVSLSPRIVRLLLSRNRIGDDGCQALAHGMRRQLERASDAEANSGWPGALIELDLDFNREIKDGAATALAFVAYTLRNSSGVETSSAGGESPTTSGATDGGNALADERRRSAWLGPWGLERLRLEGTGVTAGGCEHLACAVQFRHKLLLAGCEAIEAGEASSSPWCSPGSWVPSCLEVYGLDLPKEDGLGESNRRQMMSELRKLWPGQHITRGTMRKHPVWAGEDLRALKRARKNRDAVCLDSDSDGLIDLREPERQADDVEEEVMMTHLPCREDSSTKLTEEKESREHAELERQDTGTGFGFWQNPMGTFFANLWKGSKEEIETESLTPEEAAEPDPVRDWYNEDETDRVGDWFNSECDLQPHSAQGDNLHRANDVVMLNDPASASTSEALPSAHPNMKGRARAHTFAADNPGQTRRVSVKTLIDSECFQSESAKVDADLAAGSSEAAASSSGVFRASSSGAELGTVSVRERAASWGMVESAPTLPIGRGATQGKGGEISGSHAGPNFRADGRGGVGDGESSVAGCSVSGSEAGDSEIARLKAENEVLKSQIAKSKAEPPVENKAAAVSDSAASSSPKASTPKGKGSGKGVPPPAPKGKGAEPAADTPKAGGKGKPSPPAKAPEASPKGGKGPKGAPPKAPAGKGPGKGAPPKAPGAKGKAAPSKASSAASKDGTKTPKAPSAADMPFGRKIHFVKPMYEPGEECVWHSLTGEGDAEFNPDLLSALFEDSKRKDAGPRKSFGSAAKKSAGKSIIEAKRAQNIAIVLNRLPMNTDDLVASLRELDFSNATLTVEDIELVMGVLPTPQEIKDLLPFMDKRDELRPDVEQKILPFCTLERAVARMEIMRKAVSHSAQRATLLSKLRCVKMACNEAQSSKRLQQLLVVALKMGNYINAAKSDQGAMKGFGLESLSALATFKMGPASTLHFLCLTFRSSSTFLNELKADLQHVPEASKMKSEHTAKLVDAFVAEMTFVGRQAEVFQGQAGHERLVVLHQELTRESDEVKQHRVEVEKAAADVQKFFNVTGKGNNMPPIEETLEHIASFLEQFASVWQEIEKNPAKWRKYANQEKDGQAMGIGTTDSVGDAANPSGRRRANTLKRGSFSSRVMGADSSVQSTVSTVAMDTASQSAEAPEASPPSTRAAEVPPQTTSMCNAALSKPTTNAPEEAGATTAPMQLNSGMLADALPATTREVVSTVPESDKTQRATEDQPVAAKAPPIQIKNLDEDKTTEKSVEASPITDTSQAKSGTTSTIMPPQSSEPSSAIVRQSSILTDADEAGRSYVAALRSGGVPLGEAFSSTTPIVQRVLGEEHQEPFSGNDPSALASGDDADSIGPWDSASQVAASTSNTGPPAPSTAQLSGDGDLALPALSSHVRPVELEAATVPSVALSEAQLQSKDGTVGEAATSTMPALAPAATPVEAPAAVPAAAAAVPAEAPKETAQAETATASAASMPPSAAPAVAVSAPTSTLKSQGCNREKEPATKTSRFPARPPVALGTLAKAAAAAAGNLGATPRHELDKCDAVDKYQSPLHVSPKNARMSFSKYEAELEEVLAMPEADKPAAQAHAVGKSVEDNSQRTSEVADGCHKDDVRNDTCQPRTSMMVKLDERYRLLEQDEANGGVNSSAPLANSVEKGVEDHAIGPMIMSEGYREGDVQQDTGQPRTSMMVKLDERYRLLEQSEADGCVGSSSAPANAVEKGAEEHATRPMHVLEGCREGDVQNNAGQPRTSMMVKLDERYRRLEQAEADAGGSSNSVSQANAVEKGVESHTNTLMSVPEGCREGDVQNDMDQPTTSVMKLDVPPRLPEQAETDCGVSSSALQVGSVEKSLEDGKEGLTALPENDSDEEF